ncbi:unnamed protein product [Urochloa decumbens]|uniref:Sec16 Sec23-binding domain-containing protein n=1 Tax=Urochloa decumbens TaxID=240449 RepID=A0ABC8XRS9_9POAL
MECIKSVQRAALAALPPDGAPYLAAGTVAGAVDADFSSASTVELFGLDFRSDATDLPLLASAPAPDRFYRLRWSRPLAPGGDSLGLGLLAGGLGDGTVAVWNPRAMISSEGEGADDAMVARLEKHKGPVRGLDFSKFRPHMLATGADDGEVIVWDLKNPAIPDVCCQLKNTGSFAQSEISYISWNPQHSHILASTSYNGITAVWDMDNKRPVINLSDSNRRRCSVFQWNPDMPSQLIIAPEEGNSPLRESCLTNKRICGTFLLYFLRTYMTTEQFAGILLIVTEIPTNSNGNFDLHWYRKIPGVVAASSYDGKLGIYNLGFSGRYEGGEDAQSESVNTRAQSPKWLKCPAGASFGFGSKFVSFHPTASPQAVGWQVNLSLVTEQSLLSRSTEFEADIQDGEKISLRALCDKKSKGSLSEEERETWGFLKVFLADEGTTRTNLLAHLGFNALEVTTRDSTNELGKTLSDMLNIDNDPFTGSMDARVLVDNEDGFVNNLQLSQKKLSRERNSTAGEQTLQETVDKSAMSDPSVDASIQRALVTGDYKVAVNQCISANRIADALVIAHAGGSTLWESTCNNYIRNSTSPYLKTIHAVVANDLMSLVGTCPLHSWKETLALLCTYAQGEEWTVLCNTLASRLLSVGDRLAASLCYMCAGNIDKTVEIWSHNLKSHGGDDVHQSSSDLMEKIITLALATGCKRFSASVSKVVENYAELLAGQGLLKTAMKYLELLGSDENSNELSMLKKRISLYNGANGTASPRSLAPYSSDSSSSYLANPSNHDAPFQPPGFPVQCQNGPPMSSDGTSAPPPGTVVNQKFAQFVSANATRFMPSSNQSFVQRQGDPMKPSSPAQSQPESAAAPPAPSPTVHTVDSSNVPAELTPVIATLTRLFDETSKANPSKKREIEDNSRKIGALFEKLNKRDISPNVSSKLIQLCSALDNGDFAAAQQLQVVLTTSDWDECFIWLAALKRLIKARQNLKA